MKKKLVNQDFAKAAGKYSVIRIDWKNWKKELPKSGQDIWVVIRLDNGYYPVTGTYFDETFPASKDGVVPKSRWQSVKFTEGSIPDTFMGSKDWKRLVAWGVQSGVVRLSKKILIEYAPTNSKKGS